MRLQDWYRLTRRSVVAGVAAMFLPLVFGGSAHAEQSGPLFLVTGPPATGVRAGTDQTVLEFVHSGSSTGPVQPGVSVHFDVLSGPNSGQSKTIVTNQSGVAVFKFSTTASVPGGGDDVVRAFVDENSNGSPDGTEPVVTTTVTTLQSHNAAPVVVPVHSDVKENTPTNIALSGTDPEGQRVGFEIQDHPIHGSLPTFFTGPQIQYTPNHGYTGADSFTYRVTDAQGLSTIGRVSITVTPDNATSLSCDGLPATIVARPGVTTFGTGGNDVIVGTDGDDTIYGLGGNDHICGVGGNDSIYGGAGDDQVVVGDGASVVYGGDGNDTVVAGSGSNMVFGGNGDDRLEVANGTNMAFGGPGSDVLTAGSGPNLLSGGDGDDTITAATSEAWAWGGNGTDNVTAGSMHMVG